METKLCRYCDTVKSRDDFHNHKGAIDGKQAMCILCARAYKTNYKKENKEKLAESARKYHQEHKAEISEYRKEYKAKNKEKISAQNKEYKLATKDHVKEYAKEYRITAKLLRREYKHRRKAWMKNNPYEKVDFKIIMERDKFICHICEKHIENDDVHFDHVIPLCMGGGHTYDNIKMAHSFCNMSKGGRMLEG